MQELLPYVCFWVKATPYLEIKNTHINLYFQVVFNFTELCQYPCACRHMEFGFLVCFYLWWLMPPVYVYRWNDHQQRQTGSLDRDRCIAISAHIWVHVEEKAVVDSSTRWVLYKTRSHKWLFGKDAITKSILTHSSLFARALVFIRRAAVLGAATRYTWHHCLINRSLC